MHEYTFLMYSEWCLEWTRKKDSERASERERMEELNKKDDREQNESYFSLVEQEENTLR